MQRSSWRVTLTVVSLFVASVMLTGCPKKPAPAAGPPAGGSGPPTGGTTSGTTGDAGGSGTTSPTPGAIGTGPGTGSGSAPTTPGGGTPSGTSPAPGPSLATTPPTGTTIPSLPSPKEFVETSALRDVFFDFDKYDIRTPDKQTLDDNGKWLKTNANALLLIEGHADERGTNEYNLALGERRAKATRDYLVSVGVAATRITVISYGEERPVCTDRTEACWARNRRAHFLVKQ